MKYILLSLSIFFTSLVLSPVTAQCYYENSLPGEGEEMKEGVYFRVENQRIVDNELLITPCHMKQLAKIKKNYDVKIMKSKVLTLNSLDEIIYPGNVKAIPGDVYRIVFEEKMDHDDLSSIKEEIELTFQCPVAFNTFQVVQPPYPADDRILEDFEQITNLNYMISYLKKELKDPLYETLLLNPYDDMIEDEDLSLIKRIEDQYQKVSYQRMNEFLDSPTTESCSTQIGGYVSSIQYPPVNEIILNTQKELRNTSQYGFGGKQ